MYGVIKSREMCSSFRRFLEEELPSKFGAWVYRMESLCKYQERDYLV